MSSNAKPEDPPAKLTLSRKKRRWIIGACLFGVALIIIGIAGLKYHEAITVTEAKRTIENRSQSLSKAEDLGHKSDFSGEVALKMYLATKPPQSEAHDSRFAIKVLSGLVVAYTAKKDNAGSILPPAP